MGKPRGRAFTLPPLPTRRHPISPINAAGSRTTFYAPQPGSRGRVSWTRFPPIIENPVDLSSKSVLSAILPPWPSIGRALPRRATGHPAGLELPPPSPSCHQVLLCSPASFLSPWLASPGPSPIAAYLPCADPRRASCVAAERMSSEKESRGGHIGIIDDLGVGLEHVWVKTLVVEREDRRPWNVMTTALVDGRGPTPSAPSEGRIPL